MNEFQDYYNNENESENETQWYRDDYETAVKNAVPKDKAISLYVPKVKRHRLFFRNPAVVAVISSLLTCALCLGVFSISMSAKKTTPLLPQSHSAGLTTVKNNGENGDISQAVNTHSGNILSIPEVYDKASPAVVSILSASQNGNYIQPQSTMSSGSGVIIREDGYIVTNNHVIEGASSITVQTIAGQSFEASLVGADERTDLAVLKVKSDQALPYAELGDSSEIRVGDMALAIGNPLREELAGTLTVGYISAINRSMIIDDKQMTMLQTDAAINPGNSGGALLNMYGQLIGINTAKSTGYDVEGLGFAIPINDAKPIIESIMEHGYVTGRPLIGIGGLSVTEAIAKANDLPIGVYVKEITPFGAAERAGLQLGDVITEFDGKKVETIDDINEIKNTHAVGDTIKVKYVRSGITKETKLTLLEEKPQTEKKEQKQQAQTPSIPQIPSDFFSWFGW
ncbi:MAG: trypsin-like serine protease [Ruminococcaceae bacterium]|nr:trypsin-like serine protease [Oscillospiraceae bacterium]